MTNTAPSLSETIQSSNEGMLLWHQERSILEVTELMCDVMEDAGVSRAELARRLGKTKGYVTQLLDGTTNMTIRTMSDVFTVLEYVFHPQCSLMNGSGADVGTSPRHERPTHETLIMSESFEWPDWSFDQINIEQATT